MEGTGYIFFSFNAHRTRRYTKAHQKEEIVNGIYTKAHQKEEIVKGICTIRDKCQEKAVY